MQVKQEKNGMIGESRTQALLLDNFIVSKRIPDIEGADFIVEKQYTELEQHRKAKEKITVYGIVQSKFFTNQNEVIIKKEYIEDHEGIISEFFALLHTDSENGSSIRYFFNAQEIKYNWRYSRRERENYYVFRLSDKNQFEAFKNKSKSEINKIIEEGIDKAEEFRNQKLIQKIEARYRTPEKDLSENIEEKLFAATQGKHITDKLYFALNYYRGFRRITSWRLIDKLSFLETHNALIYYAKFSLETNNSEILDFFANINIEKEVTIKNSKYFKGVKDVNFKINRIVEILNDNLIFKIINNKQVINILKLQEPSNNCPDYLFEILDLSKSYSLLTFGNKGTSDLWEWLKHAFIYFKLGKYEIAQKFYNKISDIAKQNKEDVIYFIALYNLRATAWMTFESSYSNIEIELLKLTLGERKEIIEAFVNNHYFLDYAKSIDEIYLKIKDYKERRIVNDTGDLVNRIYTKLIEYINFIDGNWLVSNSNQDFTTIVEKVIESCIISFSLKTEHSYHLNSFNDSMVQISIHYCEPDKLLNFFQRNGVNSLPYRSENEYFIKCLINFFSKKNVDFLYKEICYFDHRTNNPDLHRKAVKTFKNLCILLNFLEIDLKIDDLLKNITYFINKLDFEIYDVSLLAYPLLRKPNQFSVKDILYLINVIISKSNLLEGYLLTNCLYALEEKGFAFKSSHESIVNSLIAVSIEKPQYGSLKVLPKLLSKEKYEVYSNRIQNQLESKFNHELYYEATINKCIKNPLEFFDIFLNFYDSITKNQPVPILFISKSPYTGIIEPLREKLNNLVEIFFVINEEILNQKPIILNVKEYHPYYNFILSINQFNVSDQFDKFWILENQSEVILKRLANNKHLNTILKKELTKQYHKELGSIYIKYFTT